MSSPLPETDEGKATLAGKRLGLYEVEGLIGAGGMGEVYLARDPRLQRAVALKVLPPESSLNPERLARLEREARMLAALNHPNVAAIHGLEEVDGTRFLVLELVEGQTLADRLKCGPLPPDEALGVCRQIAEGLEAAHEKGVIHRDLKPANIKLTLEGKVKILDFGLAKGRQAAADPEASTITAQDMTRQGMVLGTPAYMSPEQALGRPLDKRTDIWAFGCVVYECLTGERAFQGETTTETLATILKGEPDWQALPPTTSHKLRDLLHRCLQKDPRERLHDIADARIELEEQIMLPSEPLPVKPRLWRGALVGAGLAAFVIGLVLGGAALKYFQREAPPAPQAVARVTIKLEPGQWLAGARWGFPYGIEHPTRTALDVSSDGHFVVYCAAPANSTEQQGTNRLFLRRLDELEAKPIAGTEGASNPLLSPDNHWIGFFAGRKLMKVPVEGGVPMVLCDVVVPYGFSWGGDNQIVFAARSDSGLSRISAAGGKVEPLTTPDPSREEYAHRLPHWLPGGRGILFTIVRHGWDLHPRVALLELGTGKWKVLFEDAADARYLATGHLAFLREGTLLLVPFDLGTLRVTGGGQPVPAASGIAQALNIQYSTYCSAAGQFSISASGSLVYAAGGVLPNARNSLVWVDHTGKATPVTSHKAPFGLPRLSPDGRTIAYVTGPSEQHVWLYDLQRDTATMLTSEGRASMPLWSPDGQQLVFSWNKGAGFGNLYRQVGNAMSPMERLTQSEHNHRAASWSPNGGLIAFVQAETTNTDILLLNVQDRRVTPLFDSPWFEGFPTFSPDGKWLAYVSNETSRREVYVQSFPPGRGKWKISNNGGSEPLWAPNGRRLFYRRSPGQENLALSLDQAWAVEIQTIPDFSPEKPQLLFEQVGFGFADPVRSWDISRDGERFLMVKLEERKLQPITEIVLVQNWFEEVRRLAPNRK